MNQRESAALKDVGGTGSFTTEPTQLKVEFRYRVDHGTFKLLAYAVTSVTGEPISDDDRHAIEDNLVERAMKWHAWAASSADQTVLLGGGTVKLAVGEEHVEVEVSNVELKRSGQDPELERSLFRHMEDRRHRRILTPDHLQQVAAVYSAGAPHGTKAVRDRWPTISSATASRWVAKARLDGFLPSEGS